MTSDASQTNGKQTDAEHNHPERQRCVVQSGRWSDHVGDVSPHGNPPERSTCEAESSHPPRQDLASPHRTSRQDEERVQAQLSDEFAKVVAEIAIQAVKGGGEHRLAAGPGTFVNGVEGNDGFIIDWASGAVTERPSGLRNYEVSFYVRYVNQPLNEQNDQLAYVVSYETDSASGQSYVYLPGKTDEPYRLNTKAIYRGCEGNWFRATATWQDAVTRFLAHVAR